MCGEVQFCFLVSRAYAYTMKITMTIPRASDIPSQITNDWTNEVPCLLLSVTWQSRDFILRNKENGTWRWARSSRRCGTRSRIDHIQPENWDLLSALTYEIASCRLFAIRRLHFPETGSSESGDYATTVDALISRQVYWEVCFRWHGFYCFPLN